jgi:DNA-binding response OmpR family regulator
MKKRILIVDDEPDFTTMLRLTLEAEGYYEVQEENSASAARQAARYFDPDLMILDIMMPEFDGSELAASFKNDKLLGEVPVIFMTALVDGSESEEPAGVCTRGGQTFLPKGAPIERLIACIEEKLRPRALAV